MIECEVQSHDAYGTPRELFGKFFGVIAETVREVLGRRMVARDRRGVAEITGGNRWPRRQEPGANRGLNPQSRSDNARADTTDM